MKLLDLFCGAGGCARGYTEAGFEVHGVDIKPQPRYLLSGAVAFYQADALEFLAQHGHEYDAIHASPPCQAFSGIQNLGRARNGDYPSHPDLIGPTRDLIPVGKPYVIENVTGAKASLHSPILLCGLPFGLKVYRHRWFEVVPWMLAPTHEPHDDATPSAGNGVSPKGFISICGTGGVKGMVASQIVEYWSMAMGIDWMNRAELAQAIPPAYTRWIGERLLEHLLERAA